MISSLSPTAHNVLVLSMIETKLNDCISKLVLYKRYVDDILHFTDPIIYASVLNLFSSTHSKILQFFMKKRLKTALIF